MSGGYLEKSNDAIVYEEEPDPRSMDDAYEAVQFEGETVYLKRGNWPSEIAQILLIPNVMFIRAYFQ